MSNNIKKYFNKKPLCLYKNGAKIICLTFNEIKDIKNFLIIPPFQTNLDENKVDQMVLSYEANPHHFSSRSLITIAHIVVGTNEEYLVIDGQHRLEMSYILANKEINDTFLVALINIKSKIELDNLFTEINKDSTKCLLNNYDIFEKQIYEELKNIINKNYNFLPKSSSTNKPIYTASEFTDLIIKNKIFQNKSSVEIFNYVKNKEDIFFNKISYLEIYHSNKEVFKLCEIKSIENYSCMFLKNNNFIMYLLDGDVKPHHNYKKRQTISKKLQQEVWKKEFESKTSGKCPIYNCNNILSLDISNSWQCGHKISFNNGGTILLENLRPICPTCNQLMSDNNWDFWINDKMNKDIIDTYFEESDETIKCKFTNCINRLTSNNFKPYLHKSKKDKIKLKPVCIDCFTQI